GTSPLTLREHPNYVNKPKLGELGKRSLLFLNAAWYESISAKMGCSQHLERQRTQENFLIRIQNQENVSTAINFLTPPIHQLSEW
ncbi:MAG: hypothetical protein AB1589_19760, partial [Cyanobacteriota bacterium]